MATQALTNTNIGSGVRMVQWAALANGDTGQTLEHVEYADLTVCVQGTFGTGGSVTLKGSMDGTNFFAMSDPQGNALTRTSAALKAVTERPRYIRPECTAGDGTTAITVYLLMGRGSR